MVNHRNIFYYKNNKSNEIKAGGILFYIYDTKDNNKLKFLLIKSRNLYEDFGGRTDTADSSIQETVCREADEESNNIFKKEELINNIKDTESIYIPWTKYVLYFVELNELINPILFGTKENHDNIERTVEWIDYDVLINNAKSLNFRLRNKYFFTKINELNKDNENKNNDVEFLFV